MACKETKSKGKKRGLFALLSIALLGGLFLISKPTINRVKAEEIIEEVEEQEEPTITDDLKAKLQELEEKQFIAQLIGTLTGGVGSAILSVGFMIVNRDTMKKSLNTLKLGNNNLNEGFNRVMAITSSNDSVKVKLDGYMNEVKLLAEQNNKLAKANQELVNTQKALEENRAKEVECLLAIISSSPEMVANGTAEKVNKLYHK